MPGVAPGSCVPFHGALLTVQPDYLVAKMDTDWAQHLTVLSGASDHLIQLFNLEGCPRVSCPLGHYGWQGCCSRGLAGHCAQWQYSSHCRWSLQELWTDFRDTRHLLPELQFYLVMAFWPWSPCSSSYSDSGHSPVPALLFQPCFSLVQAWILELLPLSRRDLPYSLYCQYMAWLQILQC